MTNSLRTGKIHHAIFMGKLTISMAMASIATLNYQRVSIVRWVCKSIFTWGGTRHHLAWLVRIVQVRMHGGEMGGSWKVVRKSSHVTMLPYLKELARSSRQPKIQPPWACQRIIPSHCPNCHGFMNIINLTLASMDLCKGQLTGNNRTPLGFHVKNQALLWICLSFSTLVQMNPTGAQSSAPVLVQGKPETRTNVKLETKTAFL